MAINITKAEIWISIVLLTGFLFTATNVNSTLGQTFSIFALSSFIYLIIDPSRDLTLIRPGKLWIMPIVVGAVAYITLTLLGTLVIIPTVEGLLRLLAASTPVLSDNLTINKIIFGIMIPIGETLFFFVYGFDLIASLIGTTIKRTNFKDPKLWVLMVVISFAFLLFHITSKGVSVDSTPTLILVWVMAMMSMILVTFFEDGAEAVYFHIIANSLAVGLIPFL